MTGLVSISFRSLSPEELLALARTAGLDSVEWGGDVHVPAGDLARAEEVRALTRAAHMLPYSYGSYYKIGASDPADFARVLASADALGADVIRVWAYDHGSQETDEDTYRTVVKDAQRICDASRDKTVCLECHNLTLTDDYHAALRFMRDVARPNLATYWQPNQYRSHAYNCEAAEALAPLCHSVHVFSWEGDTRLPLAAHASRWQEYISIIRREKPDVPFMLEFMHDDNPASLAEAAETLRHWLQ